MLNAVEFQSPLFAAVGNDTCGQKRLLVKTFFLIK